MLAYAASRPRVGASQSSPNTLLFVACGHIALLAIAMSVKMAFPPRVTDPPIDVVNVPIHKPPPPVATDTRQPRHSTDNAALSPQPQLPAAADPQVPLNPGPSLGPIAIVDPGPVPLPPLTTFRPQPVGVSSDAQLLTASSDLRPPYPQSKLLSGEEASLKLRLTIDESGRVIAVDPVGRADAVFLSAARRHLRAHWRYKPAMRDGHAIPTSIVISLRFELDA
jgi:protein TonB